jgi:hypothetical protein
LELILDALLVRAISLNFNELYKFNFITITAQAITSYIEAYGSAYRSLIVTTYRPATKDKRNIRKRSVKRETCPDL